MSTSSRGGPLRDLRVLDISPFLPGPFATQIFADLGATVISVEPPAGEPGRRLKAGLHDVSHRNKRSVSLNLKTPDGVGACLGLAKSADVFVEGFRPGVADRLGVGYRTLCQVNPSLVYCSVSGYGQNGPKRNLPGHDLNYLLASGFLSFPGSWSDLRGYRPGPPVGDVAASTFAATAILAALHERAATGRGTWLDIALADAAAAVAAVRAGGSLDNDPAAKAHLLPTNDLFDTSDGVIGLGVVEDHFWNSLRDLLAPLDERVTEARFATAEDRFRNGDELSALLRAVLATQTTARWAELFAAADIPFGTLRTLSEAADDPQSAVRGVIQSSDGQRHVTFPVLRDGKPMGWLYNVAPAAGADDDLILAAVRNGADPWLAARGQARG